MGKIVKVAAHSVAKPREEGRVIHRNHYSSTKLPAEVQKKIASMNLQRVAGNAFICPASKDFWTVKGTKIVKLVVDEIPDGSIAAAPKNEPMQFLTNILDDLTL